MFARLGVDLYAIAIEKREDLEDLQESLGTAVTLLADPDGVAVEAFGVMDPDPIPPQPLARSATFFIDQEGVVRYRWLPRDYRNRPAPDDILRQIDRLR